MRDNRITGVMLILIGLGSLAGQARSELIAEWKFDEGSGSLVNDATAHNNQGQIHGAVWTEGKMGSGLQFDGGDDYVEIPDSASLDSINSSVTLMAWVKPDPDFERGAIIARFLYDYAVPINDQVFELDIGTDKLVGFSLSSDGTNEEGSNVWLKSNYAVRENEWMHVAAVSDGTTMRIYLNGAADPSSAGAPSGIHVSSRNMQIGAWEYAPGQRSTFFKGLIDEVKVFNHALSAGEIMSEFLAGATVGAVKGVITDEDTGGFISGAQVVTYLRSGLSNDQGEYSLTNLQTGQYSLRSFKGGYYSSPLVEIEVQEGIEALVDFKLSPGVAGEIVLWDTTKAYTQKNPFPDALADKADWVQVPYGVTEYTWIGDPMIENKYFYLFLFSNDEDSPCLAAKIGSGRYSSNEIYKVHDTGYRNFGMGRMWTKIIINTPEEIVVESAEKGLRFGPPGIPIVNTYHILRKPWLEVRPVESMNQQGMHAKSRLAAFVYAGVERDVVLDGKKHSEDSENIYPAAGCLGEINFHRSVSIPSGEDFMWFLTFPAGAENSELTYHGIHYPDPFWEWDDKPAAPSVGANYAYLDEKVVIGVLNSGDNWKREDVQELVSAGQVYRSSFAAPYAGIWRICGSINDDWEITDYFSEVNLQAGEHFSFVSPVYGTLDYLVVYLWDRTLNTPDEVYTPMDVYRQAVLGQGDTIGPAEPQAQAQLAVRVVPNPYIQQGGAPEKIIFSNLPAKAIVRIYTPAGRLVKSINHMALAEGGSEEWDVSGAAGGVYIYCVESGQGKLQGKVSIVK